MATAGFYESATTGKSFPIERLLNGTEQALYHDLGRGGLTSKKAKVEKQAAKQEDLF